MAKWPLIRALLLLSLSMIPSLATQKEDMPHDHRHPAAQAPFLFPEGFRRLVAGPSMSTALATKLWCTQMVPRTHLSAPECDAHNAHKALQKKDRAVSYIESAKAAAAVAAMIDDAVPRALRPLLVR